MVRVMFLCVLAGNVCFFFVCLFIQPGRVVTLVPSEDPEECVWGVAYKIPQLEVDNVRSHLDFREKGGYIKREVVFNPDPPHPEFGTIHLHVYIGAEDNPFFLGPAPVKDIAHQIYHSIGPSGANKDYLLNLAVALRTIAPQAEDDHLFALEKEVIALEASLNGDNDKTEDEI